MTTHRLAPERSQQCFPAVHKSEFQSLKGSESIIWELIYLPLLTWFFLPALGCLESSAFTRAVPGSAPGRRRSFLQRTLGRIGPEAQIFKGILLPKGVVRAQQFPHTPKFWGFELCFQGVYWCYLMQVLVCFGVHLKHYKDAPMCSLKMIKSVEKPCLPLSVDCSEK